VADTLTPDRLLSIPEALDRLPVSTPTLYRMLRRGDLPVVEVGGRTFIASSDLEAFIAARRRRRSLNDDDPVGAGSTVQAPDGGDVGRGAG
jgi:excisionase family DNA binding protein